jgi:hypothetical protein
MKVGVLVECGRQGLEDVVCRRLFALLREQSGVEFEFDILPMDNKARLIQECGTAASLLLGNGCDRVVILWDERPAWPKASEKLCWHNDRQDIQSNLRRAQVDHAVIHLVCIEREFESWLLYDERMLSCVLSTAAHPVRVGRQRTPHRMTNPKGTMTSLFRQHRGWRYVDVQYAPDFARCLENLSRLRRCESFQRFAERVTGRKLSQSNRRRKE